VSIVVREGLPFTIEAEEFAEHSGGPPHV
jgi:hypothetical protein